MAALSRARREQRGFGGGTTTLFINSNNTDRRSRCDATRRCVIPCENIATKSPTRKNTCRRVRDESSKTDDLLKTTTLVGGERTKDSSAAFDHAATTFDLAKFQP